MVGLVQGEFLATQIVHGGVLTCTTVFADALNRGCSGVRLNGTVIAAAPGNLRPVVLMLCGAVVGMNAYVSLGVSTTTAVPHIRWDGSKWTVSTDGSPQDTLTSLNCVPPA